MPAHAKQQHRTVAAVAGDGKAGEEPEKGLGGGRVLGCHHVLGDGQKVLQRAGLGVPRMRTEPRHQLRVKVGADAAEAVPAVQQGVLQRRDVGVVEAEACPERAQRRQRRQLGANARRVAARVL